MVRSRYIPERGDLVWLNFSPQEGHEQAGMRPALVLSPQAYNQKSSLMLVCPVTSKIKGYPFEVLVKAKKIKGAVLADQLKSIDWRARKASFIEHAPHLTLSRTKELIELLVTG
jgi:mRNA interferase MazF